jgi:beta-lactam-binding protein with PASTA domain
MNKKIFFTIIPFISFIISYIAISEYIHRDRKVKLINITGKKLTEALKWIYNSGLSIRISKVILDNNKEDGLIIAQYPKENTIVSQQASIFCDISIHKSFEIPDLIGKEYEESADILDKIGIKYKKIEIESIYPANTIYALSKNNENTLSLYVSTGISKKYIIKNFIGSKCSDIKNTMPFLNIICMDSNHNQICDIHDFYITDQFPKAHTELKIKDNLYLWH